MVEDKELVIAIDGPAGAGKSTVAKKVADKLSYIYIDTGAMYRALTLKALRENVDVESAAELADLAHQTKIKFEKEGNQELVILDGENVTEQIRTNKVSNNVSLVAQIKEVREQLVKWQRQMAAQGGLVMDGRDIGTVVLPNADLKIFLTASVTERTKRRYQDLKNNGEVVDFEQLKKEIIRRDELDKNREFSPLKKAKDAHVIDTTDLDIPEVVNRIISLWREV
ncbi:MAG: (d)CMP kinase [Bacillota bacterium]